MEKHNKIIIVSVIAGLLIGGLFGYFLGYTAGLSWSFDKAIWLLDHQGIKIEFNSQMIKSGLFQYKNNVGGCLFTDNLTDARLYNSTRN